MAMTNEEKLRFLRGPDGKLAAWAWPGGYPIVYVAYEDNEPVWLCPQCADKDKHKGHLVSADINWEDPELYCDDCNERIESAYAEEN
jgi:hypothetical protein